MIPVKFLSKIGVYEVQIDGVTLKVRVARHNEHSVLDIGISELTSQFGTTVVGLVLQPDESPKYLQLCVGTYCLMYQLPPTAAIPFSYFQIPKSLKDFLSDSEICFVGVGESPSSHHVYENCKSYVKLSELGARVLMKPSLSGCSLEALANEVGINLAESSSGVNVDWDAKIFTKEEIKCGTRDVCACYLIGNKLLGSL
ncbi:hypothetical protein LguiA_026709 [Lonicera macranthoides]